MTRFFQSATTDFLRAKHILASRLFGNGTPPETTEQQDNAQTSTCDVTISNEEDNNYRSMAATEDQNHTVDHDYTVRPSKFFKNHN